MSFELSECVSFLPVEAQYRLSGVPLRLDKSLSRSCGLALLPPLDLSDTMDAPGPSPHLTTPLPPKPLALGDFLSSEEFVALGYDTGDVLLPSLCWGYFFNNSSDSLFTVTLVGLLLPSSSVGVDVPEYPPAAAIGKEDFLFEMLPIISLTLIPVATPVEVEVGVVFGGEDFDRIIGVADLSILGVVIAVMTGSTGIIPDVKAEASTRDENVVETGRVWLAVPDKELEPGMEPDARGIPEGFVG